MAAPYTKQQIRLHWIIFLLIAFQFLAHEPISEAWSQIQREGSAEFHPLVFTHVAVGVLILVLVLLHVAGVAVESRAMGRSLVAPMLAHWSTNGLGYLFAWWAWNR